MLIRALFAFLALPGVVAGLVPFLIASADTQRQGGSATSFGVLALINPRSSNIPLMNPVSTSAVMK
jgi:hypothetical protein